MIIHVIVLATLLFTSTLSFSEENSTTETTKLHMDRENVAQLASGYRSMRSTLEMEKTSLNTQGLDHLLIVGCPQFSEGEFYALLTQIQKEHPDSLPHHVYIFDLREESHGFVQGHSIYWHGPRNDANKGIALDILLPQEHEQLKNLKKQSVVSAPLKKLWRDPPLKNSVFALSTHEPYTEKALVQGAGSHYIRVPITDHCPPTPHQVDLFLSYFRDLPKEAISVFHCKGGWGRTTTFMVLSDIWMNHDKASCTEIIARQAAFPESMDLAHHQVLDNKWKIEKSKERLKLIQDFYEYAHTPDVKNQMTFREFTLRRYFKK